jgi:hypothetical protein
VRFTRALACAAALLLAPSLAQAAEPNPELSDSDSSAAELAEPFFELERPTLLAYAPGPAALIGPPIYAKRARDRTFGTEYGERDPRVRERPHTHRFRLAIHSQYIRLPQAANTNTGTTTRFHFAPLMLDLAYQAQFLKYVMVRIAVAAGGNVSNVRHAMPGVVYPQGYVGYQGKIVGVAFGYGFIWTIPPNFDAIDPSDPNALKQPVITRNNVVMGEFSATSKIDRVAMTFSLAIGGVQSDLSHYDVVNRKWRFYLGLQAGMYFDGTIRKERKARKKADAEGR